MSPAANGCNCPGWRSLICRLDAWNHKRLDGRMTRWHHVAAMVCGLHERFITGEFYEDDEPVADVEAAYEQGPKATTNPLPEDPPEWRYPTPEQVSEAGARQAARWSETLRLLGSGPEPDPLPAQVRRAGGAQVGDGNGK